MMNEALGFVHHYLLKGKKIYIPSFNAWLYLILQSQVGVRRQRSENVQIGQNIR